jgi:hypothetical protein
MSTMRDRQGATTADVLVFLSTLALAAALLYPAWSAREFRARVEGAVADVEAVTAVARSSLEATGSWPTPTPVGETPPEITGVSREGNPFVRADYRLEWTTWSVVDSVPAPPDLTPTLDDVLIDSAGPAMQPIVEVVGALVVHTSDSALLAELSDRYAEQISFALDTIWMLVLPERAR